jgi:hypothetical protein
MDSVSAKPEEVAAYQSSEAKQAKLQSMLSALLEDPILADVPWKPSLTDVDTLINLELGSAMRVTVVKLDNTSFGTHNPLQISFLILALSLNFHLVGTTNLVLNFYLLLFPCDRCSCVKLGYSQGFETGYQEEDK